MSRRRGSPEPRAAQAQGDRRRQVPAALRGHQVPAGQGGDLRSLAGMDRLTDLARPQFMRTRGDRYCRAGLPLASGPEGTIGEISSARLPPVAPQADRRQPSFQKWADRRRPPFDK